VKAYILEKEKDKFNSRGGKKELRGETVEVLEVKRGNLCD